MINKIDSLYYITSSIFTKLFISFSVIYNTLFKAIKNRDTV